MAAAKQSPRHLHGIRWSLSLQARDDGFHPRASGVFPAAAPDAVIRPALERLLRSYYPAKDGDVLTLAPVN